MSGVPHDPRVPGNGPQPPQVVDRHHSGGVVADVDHLIRLLGRHSKIETTKIIYRHMFA